MLSSGSPCGSRSPRVGCWTRTWRRGLIARHNDFRSNPSCRAKPWTVVCSRRSCHGGAHEHVGALDRLHMRFGNAQECVAADEGSCRRFAESRSVGQRRGPRGRSVACSLLIIEDVQSGICDGAAAAACLSSSQRASLRRSRAPRGSRRRSPRHCGRSRRQLRHQSCPPTPARCVPGCSTRRQCRCA